MHRKNLAKRINTMLTILLLLLLIPLFLTIFCQKMQLEELLGNVNRTAEKEEDADMLFCIVAKEISADAPEECIKAQCVIARTNLKAAEEMGTELPGSMTMGAGRLLCRRGRAGSRFQCRTVFADQQCILYPIGICQHRAFPDPGNGLQQICYFGGCV